MKRIAARLRGLAATAVVGAVVVRRRLRRDQGPSESRPGLGRSLDRESAEAALATIAGDVSGSVGFSSWHAESGLALAINGDRPFPMASLIKLSVALHIFRRIDAGTASLRDVVELAPRHWRPGSGLLAQYLTSLPCRRPSVGPRPLAISPTPETPRVPKTSSDSCGDCGKVTWCRDPAGSG